MSSEDVKAFLLKHKHTDYTYATDGTATVVTDTHHKSYNWPSNEIDEEPDFITAENIPSTYSEQADFSRIRVGEHVYSSERKLREGFSTSSELSQSLLNDIKDLCKTPLQQESWETQAPTSEQKILTGEPEFLTAERDAEVNYTEKELSQAEIARGPEVQESDDKVPRDTTVFEFEEKASPEVAPSESENREERKDITEENQIIDAGLPEVQEEIQEEIQQMDEQEAPQEAQANENESAAGDESESEVISTSNNHLSDYFESKRNPR